MAAGVIATTESDAPPKSKVKDSSLTALSRTVALLFSRPVRLFRPAKLSGVAALSYAAQAKGHGDVYSFAGLRSLFRAEGFFFVPRQMLPPLVINGVLGFQLFFTYSTSLLALQSVKPSQRPRQTALPFICGSLAGATQSIISAPLDNVRLVLHDTKSRWPGWISVLRQSIFPAYFATSTSSTSKSGRLRNLRQWGSRGSSMLALGVIRDALGFGAFFGVFENGRLVAKRARAFLRQTVALSSWSSNVVQAALLVAFGAAASLSFGTLAKPFDIARGILWEARMQWASDWQTYRADQNAGHSGIRPSSTVPRASQTFRHVLHEEGWRTFIGQGNVSHPRASNISGASNLASAVEIGPSSFARSSRRFVETSTMRTRLLGLVPYSAAFLVWAALYGDFRDTEELDLNAFAPA